MEQDEMMAIGFSIIVVMIFLYGFARLVEPMADKEILVLDDRISLYVDTMSSMESGRAMINVDGTLVDEVSVRYETEGKKSNYEIPSNGWYVVVAFKAMPYSNRRIVTASRIDVYSYNEGVPVTLASPSKVCVVKESDEKYAEVRAC